MRKIASILVCGVMLGVLVGCLSFVQEGSLLGGGNTTDELIVINSVHPHAAAPSDDPYPLFVGAEWIYRNATGDFNPEVHPSSLLASQVLANVYCVDLETGDAWECFAVRATDLRTTKSISYLHRQSNGVYRFSEILRDPAVDFPGYLLLPNPLIQDTYLVYNVPKFDGDALWERAVGCSGDRNSLNIGGEGDCAAGSEVVTLSVLFRPEVVGLSTIVNSVLGAYTTYFASAWKLEIYEGIESYPDYQWWTTSSDLAWLAPGIGVVKWVKGSSSFELVEFVHEDEQLALSPASESKWYNSAEGTRIVFQFRGTDPEGEDAVTWRVAEINGLTSANEPSDDILRQLGERAYYHDIDTTGRELDSGTFVYTFEANQPGYVNFQFEASDSIDGVGQTEFRIKVGDFNSTPVAVDDQFDVDQNSAESELDVLQNDYEIDPVDYVRISEIESPPSNGIVRLVDGVIFYAPNQDYVGWDSFTYTIEDKYGLTADARVRIQITEVADSSPS